jgi:ankyrin repeat protein
MFRPSPKFIEKLEAESKSSSTLPPEHRAFLDAARTGDVDTIGDLLAKGVPVDLREDFSVRYSQSEQTALMYAAAGGHLEVVRQLLKAGADVKAVDKVMSRDDGGQNTALHYAASQSNVAVVEELLNAGADLNALTKEATNRGWTPLNYALRGGHRDVVQLLVNRGANLSSRVGRKQALSPLCAVLDAQLSQVPPETIRDLFLLLLEGKADPNGTGDANMTALSRLAGADIDEPGRLPADIIHQLMEALLKAGASPDSLDKFGSTPLEGALIRLNAAAVTMLLEAGADVNRVFARGTALDINERDTKLLEEKLSGASDRLRAVVEARLRRCKEIHATLRKFGAKRKSELPQSN